MTTRPERITLFPRSHAFPPPAPADYDVEYIRADVVEAMLVEAREWKGRWEYEVLQRGACLMEVERLALRLAEVTRERDEARAREAHESANYIEERMRADDAEAKARRANAALLAGSDALDQARDLRSKLEAAEARERELRAFVDEVRRALDIGVPYSRVEDLRSPREVIEQALNRLDAAEREAAAALAPEPMGTTTPTAEPLAAGDEAPLTPGVCVDGCTRTVRGYLGKWTDTTKHGEKCPLTGAPSTTTGEP